MDYSPPPLFKQGASARAKVVIFALIAIGLLLADAQMRSLGAIRQVVGTALYPLQVAALLPRDAAYMVGDYFSSVSSLQRENRAMKEEKVRNAQTLQQVQQLAAENAQLRKLLDANERVPVKSVLGEILYDARDAFTRKLVLDRGSKHGVAPGQPVIDDVGVVGQVTRVFPFTSEVTLLTDKDQAIPVQVVRSGLRSIAYGLGHSGSLDLRFMPANADVQNGDVLVTSGIDGVYPPGLAVAKVTQVERKSSDAFARIMCQPMAGIDRNRQLLVLLTDTSLPPPPPPEETGKKDRPARKTAEGKESAAKEANDAPETAKPASGATQPAAAKAGNEAAKVPVPAKEAPKAPAGQAAPGPSKPDAPKPATSRPEAARGEAPKPESPKPTAPKPEAAKTEVPKQEAPKAAPKPAAATTP